MAGLVAGCFQPGFFVERYSHVKIFFIAVKFFLEQYFLLVVFFAVP